MRSFFAVILFLSFSLLASSSDHPPVRGLRLMSNNGYLDEAAFAEDSFSVTIPFSRAGNLILVKATADTTEGNFILDTGAPYLVLNITYFRDYPATQLSENQNGATGEGDAINRTTVKEFNLGGLLYHNLSADLANLGHIENSKGVRILGLLGMALFRQCELIINFEKNEIYLHRISRKEAKTYRHSMLDDTAAYRTIPIEIKDDKIITTTELKGKKLKLVIDCAAETNVLDSRLPQKLFEQVTITRRVLLAGTGQRKVDALYGDLVGMRIGNEDIGTMPVLITNLANTCFSHGGCVDGVLGFDFLSLHQIGFNFVNRKMYIWK